MDPAGFGRLVAEVSPAGYPSFPPGSLLHAHYRDTLKPPAFRHGFRHGLRGMRTTSASKARKAGKEYICCDDANVHHYGQGVVRRRRRQWTRSAARTKCCSSGRWPEYLTTLTGSAAPTPSGSSWSAGRRLRAGGAPGCRPSPRHPQFGHARRHRTAHAKHHRRSGVAVPENGHPPRPAIREMGRRRGEERRRTISASRKCARSRATRASSSWGRTGTFRTATRRPIFKRPQWGGYTASSISST
jgi:hypothetical protein